MIDLMMVIRAPGCSTFRKFTLTNSDDSTSIPFMAYAGHHHS